MFEQVNIIRFSVPMKTLIVGKVHTVMVSFIHYCSLFESKKVNIGLAQHCIGNYAQLSASKKTKKRSFNTVKVNNFQYIEQFSDLVIKAKDIYKVYSYQEKINRRNIEQKNRRFSGLNVAQEYIN